MRTMCYRCFWPQALCWCGSLRPMATRTRLVFLMHPKEFKQEKAATGRLTRLCLENSELHMGLGFDDHDAVRALVADPGNLCTLLYPGRDARNVSRGEFGPADLGGRRLVVFLLDATWSGARKMLRLSPVLQHLPRLGFDATAPSRYVIKQQPEPGCLSTLEAVHELLLALDAAGLDRYEDRAQLLAVFARMQEHQLRCAADPARTGYRRRPYSDPAARLGPQGTAGARRRYLPRPGG
jgi:DTW domain-containing protein YfiP